MGEFEYDVVVLEKRKVEPALCKPAAKKQRKAVEKTFKRAVRQRFQDRRFAIHHHSSIAHPGLQAADYCTWAVYRKYQRGDLRSYDLISAYIRSEVDVFAAKSVTYY